MPSVIILIEKALSQTTKKNRLPRHCFPTDGALKEQQHELSCYRWRNAEQRHSTIYWEYICVHLVVGAWCNATSNPKPPEMSNLMAKMKICCQSLAVSKNFSTKNLLDLHTSWNMSIMLGQAYLNWMIDLNFTNWSRAPHFKRC